MSGPHQSPSMLPPPPKRGKGVRRLNNVPKYVIFGAGLAVLGGFIYSYRVRLLQTTAATEVAAERRPEAASGANVTANRPPSGQKPTPPVQTVAAQPTTPGAVQRAVENPFAGATPAPAAPAPQDARGGQPPVEDMWTQARRAAWTVYYQQVAAVQQARLDLAREAMKADTSLPQSGASGGQAAPGGNLEAQIGAADAAARQMQAQIAGLAAGAGGGQGLPAGAGGIAGIGGYGGGGAYPPPVLPDATGAREKQAFISQRGNLGTDDVLTTTLRPPISPFVVSAGDFIPFVMVSGATSDAPGQFTARVETTVYDSATGNIPLIPQNARLVGHYDNVVSAGQERLPAVVTAIKFPDGSTLPLGAMPAGDRAGFAGMHDKVYTHLGQKFANALLFSLPGAAIQLGVGGGSGSAFGGYNAQQTAASAVAQQIGQLAQEQARAGLAIPNTNAIRPGWRGALQITKDIVMPGPYRDRRQAPAAGINVSMPVMR